MPRRHLADSRRAFTITEIIVVVIIIGVLAAIIAPRVINRVGQSKRAVAQSKAANLATAMRLYIADNSLPEPGASIEILWVRPGDIDEANWKGPYVENAQALEDPWGNLFTLVIPPTFNADFDIVSYGADGQPGGEGDENRDIINGQK